MSIGRFISSLYFTPRFFVFCGVVVLLYVLSFFVEWIESIAITALLTLVVLTLLEIVMLSLRDGISAQRRMHDRLSNGDDNEIGIQLRNDYAFTASLTIIDELPFQFQVRDAKHQCRVAPSQASERHYTVRPVERGEYHFGALNVYASWLIACVQRRFRFAEHVMVPVYPSYLQMRKYELMAASNRLTEVGIKRQRRVGVAREFDQIREYVAGDEYRTINWNATARRADLMVNQYQDEKSQPVYSLIDMGRSMKMPFEGLTLLDYAINTSLVISNIVMLKDDKAGVISFSEGAPSIVSAERGRGHMNTILKFLYKQHTGFLEPNYELLAATIRRRVHQRSLLFLYTNFETVSNLKRQMPYLKNLAAHHVLCVIFFENTELASFLERPARTLEEIYTHSIAEKFRFEKKIMMRELSGHGIRCISTKPQQLSVATINAYLELKSRGVI